MKALAQTLAMLALVIAAGGRFTVAWQQHGGHPYASSSMPENLFLGSVNFAIGVALLWGSTQE